MAAVSIAAWIAMDEFAVVLLPAMDEFAVVLPPAMDEFAVVLPRLRLLFVSKS
jgi:hypothetical protein